MRLHMVCMAALAAMVLPYARGEEHLALEKTTVAFHEARVRQRPDDAGAFRMLAEALVKFAEASTDPRAYDRAWQALETAEALEPGNTDTLRSRARLLLSRHRFPQALALAKQGLIAAPRDTDLLGIAGDAAFEQGDMDSAAMYYRALHALSRQLNTWARLAQLAEARNELDEAARLLLQAMEEGKRRGAPSESIAWCHAVLGEVYLKRGDPAEARRQYAVGLQKHPDHPLVLEHLAELEKLEGKLPAAESAYRNLLAKRPDPVNHLRLADVLAERDDRKGASELRKESVRQIEQAVALGNEGFLRPLAELELEAGRFERAAALALRDVGLRPNDASRVLLEKILSAAAAAGKAVNAAGSPSLSTH